MHADIGLLKQISYSTGSRRTYANSERRVLLTAVRHTFVDRAVFRAFTEMRVGLHNSRAYIDLVIKLN